MMEEKLPKGWRLTPINDFAKTKSGGTPSTSRPDYWDGDVPWINSGMLKDSEINKPSKFITKLGLKESSATLFPIETVVIALTGATTGKVGLLKIETSTNQSVTGILPNNSFNSKFLFYQLRFLRSNILKDALGTAQPHINKRIVDETIVKLPPIKEQHRIVAKLDTLFGHLDRVREKLDGIPALLKNFRQQVLTQAVTGELTKEWREGKGLPMQQTREKRNKDYSLDDIPNVWIHSTIGTIASVKGGKRIPKGEALTEEITNHPYIRARDLKKGTVLTENLLYITEDVHEKISKYIVNEGDVYITIVGAKIGDAGIIPESMDGANLTENAAKLTEMKNVIPTYLSIWLRSPICQSFIQKTIMSAAQGKLALTRIKNLPIYLPHIDEQAEIVKRVDSFLRLADKIESQYASLKAKIEQLPQAILAKAFRGELVEQEVKGYEVGESEGLMAAEDRERYEIE